VSRGIQHPPRIPDRLINIEQTPGADLSLNKQPNHIPIKIFIINIGSWLINKRIISLKEIKVVLVNKAIRSPEMMQIIV